MFAAVVEWGWVIQWSHHIVGMERLEAPGVGYSESPCVRNFMRSNFIHHQKWSAFETSSTTRSDPLSLTRCRCSCKTREHQQQHRKNKLHNYTHKERTV